MKKVLTVILVAAMLALGGTAAMAETHGLGLVSSIASSTPAADGANANAQVDTTVCAVALDDSGIITAISFDVAQTKIAVSDKGEILSDLSAAILSKKEAGDAYGMKAASGIGKEIYEQIEALEAWCIGKTVEEAVTKATAGDADLLAGATIHLNDYTAALIKAANNAK